MVQNLPHHWCGGGLLALYLVRLFIYHVEAAEQGAHPSGFRAAIRFDGAAAGQHHHHPRHGGGELRCGLLVVNPSWLQQSWMHAKLLFVAFAATTGCYRLMGQLQRGECGWSGRQLRALNELPTLLLVIVVLLVVFKQQPSPVPPPGSPLPVVFMAASIQFYARWRRFALSGRLPMPVDQHPCDRFELGDPAVVPRLNFHCHSLCSDGSLARANR